MEMVVFFGNLCLGCLILKYYWFLIVLGCLETQFSSEVELFLIYCMCPRMRFMGYLMWDIFTHGQGMVFKGGLNKVNNLFLAHQSYLEWIS